MKPGSRKQFSPRKLPRMKHSHFRPPPLLPLQSAAWWRKAQIPSPPHHGKSIHTPPQRRKTREERKGIRKEEMSEKMGKTGKTDLISSLSSGGRPPFCFVSFFLSSGSHSFTDFTDSRKKGNGRKSGRKRESRRKKRKRETFLLLSSIFRLRATRCPAASPICCKTHCPDWRHSSPVPGHFRCGHARSSGSSGACWPSPDGREER